MTVSAFRKISIKYIHTDASGFIAQKVEARVEPCGSMAIVRAGIDIGLGNAVPVCAARDSDGQRILAALLRAGDGGLVSEGRSKLVIDPSGQVLCHYGIDAPLGQALGDLRELWQYPAATKMRDASNLPNQCTSCEHLGVCLGGSRIAARTAYGTYAAPDPLMPR
jgi:radical SAM protein with 4Fe4S-binding SPASM domain